MAKVTSQGVKIANTEVITISKSETQNTNAGDLITFQNSNSSNNYKKLKLQSNGVKIGSGVSKIKVSANLVYSSLGTTRQWFRLFKNDTLINDFIFYGTNNFMTANCISKMINVQENDLITIQLYNIEGTGHIGISAGLSRESTYMTVEAVK